MFYSPPAGFGLSAIGTDGPAARPMFNSGQPGELPYVGGDNHIRLVTELPVPSASSCARPYGVASGQNGIAVTHLSGHRR